MVEDIIQESPSGLQGINVKNLNSRPCHPQKQLMFSAGFESQPQYSL